LYWILLSRFMLPGAGFRLNMEKVSGDQSEFTKNVFFQSAGTCTCTQDQNHTDALWPYSGVPEVATSQNYTATLHKRQCATLNCTIKASTIQLPAWPYRQASTKLHFKHSDLQLTSKHSD
jgi:hypothetical protein